MTAMALRAADAQALAQGGVVRTEHQFPVQDQRVDLTAMRMALPSVSGQRPDLLCVWSNVSTQHRKESQLQAALAQLEQQQIALDTLRREHEDLGVRDLATGLYHRAHFEEQVRREVDLSVREQREFAIVLISVDALDAFSTAHGTAARDRVLESLGRLLRANTRVMDAPCRLEDGRFAVLLSGVGLATAHSRMEGLRRQCATHIVAVSGQELHFTVSMGVASFPHTAASQDELMQATEVSLADAERRGGNRVSLAAIRFGS